MRKRHAGTQRADMVFCFARQDKSLPVNMYTGAAGCAYLARQLDDNSLPKLIIRLPL